MKNKKHSSKHIAFIFILIAGWFVWFQLRPSLIRARCYKDTTGFGFSLTGTQYYEKCLHKYGLK